MSNPDKPNNTPTDIGQWADRHIPPGDSADVAITVSESYAGMDIDIPLHIRRAKKPGPAVFVSAAVHGDEINGTGAIRQLIAEPAFALTRGTLVLVPVVNLLGFERHSRYLPDRRDLNRSFPGSPTGSLASRLAHALFTQVVQRCDFGIDLHTAAVRRTNFPNVRANLRDPKLAPFARAFGTELILSSKAPKGSLRRAACEAGCPTLILEAGEVWKVEPTVVEYTLRGVHNCLIHLGMADGQPTEPTYVLEADKTQWVRAQHGGFLAFHVGPGDIIKKDDPIATNTSLLGHEHNTITAPRDGVVLGMTTLPSVAPGDPVCHLAYVKKGSLKKIERARDKMKDDSLHQRTHDQLSTNVLVSEAGEENGDDR
ncbi:M14 family metallopeptidase [Phycisphaeraceae bacterium D3-23]